MSERPVHARKAAEFIKEMMTYVDEFRNAKPYSKAQYKAFLKANQAWKSAEIHEQEALMPDITRLMRKATRMRIVVNRQFFDYVMKSVSAMGAK